MRAIPPPLSLSMVDEPFEHVMDRLTVLRGFSELLLEGTFGPVSPDQRRVLLEMMMEVDELRIILSRNETPFTTPTARPRY